MMGPIEPGVRCLVACFVWWPFSEILLVYGLGNIAFCASPIFWRKAYGSVRAIYGVVLTLGCGAALTVPVYWERVYVGYYLWIGSFAISAVAFFVSAAVWPGDTDEERVA